jgi:VanZ family protein
VRPSRSVAIHLAWVYALLLVYASLFPFEGWRWPAGAALHELARLNWPPWRNRFDEWSNVLGYVPLGLAVFGAVMGGARRPPALVAWLLAGAAGAALSYAMEFTQHFIPGRFPSLRDWTNNTVGAAAGGLLAWVLQALGWWRAGVRWRDRWFHPHSSAALVLLALWPLGLLFPTPMPLGIGQIGGEPWSEQLRELLDALMGKDGAAAELAARLGVPAPMTAQREAWVLAAGLAGPCLLAGVVTRGGWRRWLLAPAAAVIALGVMTLSTALNVGPDHATAWMTRLHLQTLAAAVLVCAALCLMGPRWCAVASLLALLVLVVLVADAPSDPYYVASLQGWEQGRFIRFHGLSQLIGWLWPYAAMAWLLGWLLGRR